MFTIFLSLTAFFPPGLGQIQQTWHRDQQFLIPLQSDTGTGYWGEPDRKADHAAVAMNGVGDVLVAFHSSRPTFNPLYPTLKQVEVALVAYDPLTDSWSLSLQNQRVVGGVDPSPLFPGLSQQDVKCERPDVIAVGEWFFVVWTRIYERNYGGAFGSPSSQINEPAVLECAWIKKDSNGLMQVYTYNASTGAGFELDRDSSSSHFFVRECAGCPDAVVLHPGDPNAAPPIPPTVGVVYPHETDFGDYNPTTGGPGGDAIRRFELRFQTCSIDPATFTITAVKYPPLVAANPPPAGIRYDGPADAAGIILPDVAPGSAPWRFGLAYEEQTTQPVTTGRIQLQTWDVDPTGPGLALIASQSFGNPNDPAFRRRPVIASYPPAFPGEDVFAIAFNKTIAGADADVAYEEWI